MSIDAITLRNFRGFRDATLDLKPLTVLLGPNSSGKSSFGHALAAMAHAHRALVPSTKPSLSPANPRDAEQWPSDLGGLADLRTYGVKEEPVVIGLRTSAGWVEYGFGRDSETELKLSRLLHPFGQNASAPRIVKQDPDSLANDQRATTGTGRSTIMTIDELGASAALELHRIDEINWRHGNLPAVLGFEGMILMSAGHSSGTGMLVSGVARDELRELLETLTYLRAVRERPLRGHPRGKGERQTIGYSGEWTASFIESATGNITHQMPPEVPDNPKAAREWNYDWKQRSEPLVSALNQWLRHLGLADRVDIANRPKDPSVLDTKFILSQGDPAHDITEVGFGLSQVLPVLAAGLAQPELSLFIVDLPEAHLHPRPQAMLADFFCSLALSNRYSIVETHSDMFFHRLRLRAEMHPQLRNQIAVYFVDPPCDGVCIPPRPVGLGFNDELRWPARFLQEAWEIEAQIAAVRTARS